MIIAEFRDESWNGIANKSVTNKSPHFDYKSLFGKYYSEREDCQLPLQEFPGMKMRVKGNRAQKIPTPDSPESRGTGFRGEEITHEDPPPAYTLPNQFIREVEGEPLRNWI
jgi:hypothetical protein